MPEWDITWDDGQRQWTRTTTLPTMVWFAFEDDECVEINQVSGFE